MDETQQAGKTWEEDDDDRQTLSMKESEGPDKLGLSYDNVA